MHSPIFYAVLKNDNAPLPDVTDMLDLIPGDEDIQESIPESDWGVANVNDTLGWHRGVATPEEILDVAGLNGLAQAAFTDDTKQWVCMTVTKDSAIQQLKDLNDIKTQYLNVVRKGLDHGIIVDGIIGKERYPDVFTLEDERISTDHYFKTSTYGGLRLFVYTPEAYLDGELAHSDTLAEHSIIEHMSYHLNDDGQFTLYIPTFVTGDYHF